MRGLPLGRIRSHTFTCLEVLFSVSDSLFNSHNGSTFKNLNFKSLSSLRWELDVCQGNFRDGVVLLVLSLENLWFLYRLFLKRIWRRSLSSRRFVNYTVSRVEFGSLCLNVWIGKTRHCQRRKEPVPVTMDLSLKFLVGRSWVVFVSWREV